MALSAHVAQFISQQGLLTLIDASAGPKGPHGTVAFKLVPTSCWINSQPFPAEVRKELVGEHFKTWNNEGVEYWLVPDESSTNLPGKLSHYAQTTNSNDLVNPPGGGVNRTAETFTAKNAPASVSPDAVTKYVKNNDNWENAEDAKTELNERVKRQIGH